MSNDHVQAVASRIAWRKFRAYPLLIRILHTARRTADYGAGDTLARLLGYIGGNQYKRAYQWWTGKSCGCGGRQQRLNQRYPWPPTPS